MLLIRDSTFEEMELPDVFYKYRRWDDSMQRRLITHREIYFSNPFESDVRHELDFKIDESYITEDRLFRYYFEKTGDEKFASKMIKESPVHNRDLIIQNVRQYLNGRTYIFCTSEHKNSYTLWQEFAGRGTGFCVGIDLRMLFRQQQEILGSGAKIQYYASGEIPQIPPYYKDEEERLTSMLKILFSLPSKYKMEDEYRFCKLDIPDQAVEISKDCIREVILGHNFPKEEKSAVINQIKQNIGDCVYQALIDDENQFVYVSDEKL